MPSVHKMFQKLMRNGRKHKSASTGIYTQEAFMNRDDRGNWHEKEMDVFTRREEESRFKKTKYGIRGLGI